ncbi:MAG: mechanosensitive ion channel [Hyphomicrobiaceae bacterium]
MPLPFLQVSQPEWQPLLDRLTRELPGLINQLVSPWMLPQLIVVPACYGLARWLAPRLRPQINRWLAQYQLPAKVRAFLELPLLQLKWILFVVLLWLSLAMMREMTWASRSYLVTLAASLATAWVTINLVSPIVRNKSLSRAFAVVAWSIAALHILGLLGEVQSLLDGLAVTIGELRLSALGLIKGAIILGITLWIATALSSLVEKRLHQSFELTPSVEVLFGKITKAVLILVAVAITLSAIGIQLTALTVFSGALGLGIGFGLQKVASNLMSGIIILLDRSVKPGDVIQRGQTFGWITALKGRYVSVATRDGVEYLIPNEDFITSQVINWSYSDPKVRLEVRFGVGPGSEPHRVATIACDAAVKVPRVLASPGAECHVISLDQTSLQFLLRFWIQDPVVGTTNIRSEVLMAIWDGLKTEGIGLVSAKNG